MTDPQGSIEASAEDERLALERALDEFAAQREGRLVFGEHSLPVRTVQDPATGRLIASVPVAVFFASEHVLHIPEESDDALQLLVSPEECPESAATDRWMAYHGESEHVRWAAFWIDGARHGPWVFDGDPFMKPNPLAAQEPALCRDLNSDKERLARLCAERAGVEVHCPVCVGVDPRGLHVRARFGVVRVRFDRPAADADEARALLNL